jgi:PEP-CTERM motif
MKKLVTAAFVALSLVAAPNAAHAAAITGAVAIGGLFDPTGGAGVDLSDATGIDFTDGTTVVQGGTDDYAGTTGAAVTFTDFTFSPFAGPISPLWTFIVGPNTYSFDLTSVSVTFQDASNLTLEGLGILSITGFDDTKGSWIFTGNTSGFGLFNFSATNSAIPEPASVLLLGLGFLGSAGALRRRFARTN